MQDSYEYIDKLKNKYEGSNYGYSYIILEKNNIQNTWWPVVIITGDYIDADMMCDYLQEQYADREFCISDDTPEFK